jgi:hypothetical protein
MPSTTCSSVGTTCALLFRLSYACLAALPVLSQAVVLHTPTELSEHLPGNICAAVNFTLPLVAGLAGSSLSLKLS